MWWGEDTGKPDAEYERRSNDSPRTDSSNDSERPKRRRRRQIIDPQTKRRLSHRDYEIGWIAALPVELAAAQALLDEEHESLASSPGDINSYVLGRSGNFNVAIAHVQSGAMGMDDAAHVSSHMLRSFTSIRLQLVVGIAGGNPSPKNDIRLGDVVVGTSVAQNDYGTTTRDGQFLSAGTVSSPPASIMLVVGSLRAQHHIRGSKICDVSRQIARPARPDQVPRVHYGTIGAGNGVGKHASAREQLKNQHELLCLEMEGAALKGLDTPCLVVRGICDYADSHKNKQWQPYAAATAAVYAKELLSLMQPGMIENKIYQHASSLAESSQPSDDDSLDGESIDDGKLEHILESLDFNESNVRRSTIKSAYAETCEWFLSNQDFKDWLDMTKFDDHHGMFWIKGKPGAGKSTLMKFALDHFQRKKDSIVISFFFNARGNQLEKSVQGMYRSLLVQLLRQRPRMRLALPLSVAFANIGQNTFWTTPLLEALFEQAVEVIGQEPLFCFIDALDECEPDDIQRMVYFLEDLAEKATETTRSVHICLSSRHYPHITARKTVELVLDSQQGHKEDISNYLKSKLRIGNNKAAAEVYQQLQDQAAGIFMWIALAVEMLNKARDDGAGISAIRKELDSVPQYLRTVFRDLLRRDRENRERILLFVQWVLFARRPLTPLEMYVAVRSGLNSMHGITSPWDPDEVSADVIKRFILSASQGFAEITKGRNPTVQFIHESVNDFFLKKGGMHEILDEPDEEVRRRSHDQLRLCCLRYIHGLPSSAVTSLHSGPTGEAEKIDVERFPLIEYATDNILYHANQAQGLGISQHQFLDDFQATTYSHWIRLHNHLEEHKSCRLESDVSLLYILGMRNFGNLIRQCQNTSNCLTFEKSRYGTPFIAALATGSCDAVRAFMETDREDGASGVTPRTITDDELRLRSKFSQIGGDLVHRRPGLTLALLAEHGNPQIFEFAWRHLKGDAAVRDDERRTILHYASHADVVDMLVQHGADIEARDSDGQTPLASALRRGHVEVAESLLVHGADVEARDNGRDTPLMLAAQRSSLNAVEL
ncbi:hypothetical protein Micbo1qcDRAFT_219444, partial [Microdochium bolleyi]